MIIGEVKRYLRDNNSIRVSRSVRDLAYKAMQFKEKYIREKGREPTIDIIAKELEVEREDIAYSFDAVQDPVSLQEPVYNDGAESIYIMDQVKDSKNTDEAWIENMTIKQIMKKLNDKEKILKIKDSDGKFNLRRFIFSKWTLKEGWDNPNIFTIAKLRSSGSENSKLQEVGRGLRLPVDNNLNRIDSEQFYLNYIVR